MTHARTHKYYCKKWKLHTISSGKHDSRNHTSNNDEGQAMGKLMVVTVRIADKKSKEKINVRQQSQDDSKKGYECLRGVLPYKQSVNRRTCKGMSYGRRQLFTLWKAVFNDGH